MIGLLSTIIMVAFLLTIVSITLSIVFNSKLIGIFALISFITFLGSAMYRGHVVSQSLEELGCVYFGSGQKGMPHSTPRKYYKCPDGIVRSSK
jgi:hypothetical protein